MNFKSVVFNVYLTVGILICLLFGIAAASGVRAPNFGVLDGSSSGGSGRSYGGSWGGGK